ncbi:PREDICTED: zinc finger MYM-type protein 1-like [Nicotiana attenuata]|uniref:zinc finger MYM-type protein 1-like n=1 Tax=Nicotiana attenuata TaxID=49451 RepID=UPI0009057283|nr:PREDICTED: zinc finger MYM-type protein 1-like [Nicotiana attenuata]
MSNNNDNIQENQENQTNQQLQGDLRDNSALVPSPQGSPRRSREIKAIDVLSSKKEVQRLTGMIAALERFISKSSEKCFRFFSALKKQDHFEWNEECQQALRDLKAYLSNPPLLAKPKAGERLLIYLAVRRDENLEADALANLASAADVTSDASASVIHLFHSALDPDKNELSHFDCSNRKSDSLAFVKVLVNICQKLQKNWNIKMDKFVIRSNIGQSSFNGSSRPSVSSNIAPEIQRGTILSPPSNVDSVLELGSPSPDPKERIPILQYAPNIRDEVRRHYIQKGACQPSGHAFPKTKFGNKMRQFNPDWFKGPYSQWLEYNIKSDAAFCLCCYLFKNELESRGNAGDAFTKDGFKGWNKGTERLRTHVGEVDSIHHKCFNRMQDLINQEQSIQSSFHKQSEKVKSDHRIRLNASVDVVRFLLRNGLSFRGHNESEDSEYKGLFLELLEFHGDKHSDVGKVILHKAPKNDMMICPAIQKDIVDACAKETIKAIIQDLDDDFFGILVDESKDISHKEQMALVIRYVNKRGEKTIYDLLLDHSLSSSKLRGQGYDGASNMQGRINGLKSLILQDVPSAYCVHCFAHQLQLTLVALSKKHPDVKNFFDVVTNTLNIIGAFFKRREILRQHQVEKLEELLKSGEILTGQGLNQEHMQQDSLLSLDRFAAKNLLGNIQEFEFVFLLHLMFKMLLFTNELNKALQKKDQDIVNAMRLLDLAKIRLQTMRESEFEILMNEVYSFCAIDLQLHELNSRFDVVTSDLLLGMASLNPIDSFANFDKDRIIKLAEYYPSEFDDNKLRDLSFQLDSFIVYARMPHSKFINLKGMKGLAIVMAETKLDQTWCHIYLLVKLTLILPVATASMERAFSSMKLIKSDLRNSISEEFLNGCLA